jgi:hypothetical protein
VPKTGAFDRDEVKQYFERAEMIEKWNELAQAR